MYIVIISFPVCYITNFEFDLDYLTKPFSYMTIKGGRKI